MSSICVTAQLKIVNRKEKNTPSSFCCFINNRRVQIKFLFIFLFMIPGPLSQPRRVVDNFLLLLLLLLDILHGLVVRLQLDVGHLRHLRDEGDPSGTTMVWFVLATATILVTSTTASMGHLVTITTIFLVTNFTFFSLLTTTLRDITSTSCLWSGFHRQSSPVSVIILLLSCTVPTIAGHTAWPIISWPGHVASTAHHA